MIPTNFCQPNCRNVYPHLARFEGGDFEPLRTHLLCKVWALQSSALESVSKSVSRRYTRFGESRSERVPHVEKLIFSVTQAFSAYGDDPISPLTLSS